MAIPWVGMCDQFPAAVRARCAAPTLDRGGFYRRRDRHVMPTRIRSERDQVSDYPLWFMAKYASPVAYRDRDKNTATAW